MEKKILMLGWGYPPEIDGGLDIHVAELFENLQQLGAEITLALPEKNSIDHENIVNLETSGEGMINEARSLSSEFVRLAQDYDIVHTHDWFGSEPGLKAKKYSGVKWVSTFHSLSSDRSRNPWKRMEQMEEAIVDNCDSLIAVSEILAEEIEQKYGRTPEVIHNGFSRAETSGVDVREELDIDGKMIFFVGRHAEQKGLKQLIYGFKKLLDDKEATLVLGGEGYMTGALREFVEMLGIEDRVLFTGFIQDNRLGDYYEAADVFVSPSISEPFGLTITEAIQAGTPVVATETGAEELLPDATVINVNPDSDSIRNGIMEALDKKVCPPSKTRSWKKVAEETMEIYRSL